MKFSSQNIYFIIALTFMQHCTHVHSHLFDFDIVGQIRDTIHNVLLPKHKQQPVSTSIKPAHLPTVQPLTHGVTTYIPGSSSASVQQQQEVSTLPQDPVNGTVQDGLEGRAMIDAPLINGQCEAGYKMVNGRCRKVFGRRRRKR